MVTLSSYDPADEDDDLEVAGDDPANEVFENEEPEEEAGE